MLLLVLCLVPQVASASPLRLIETDTGPHWLTPAQVQQLAQFNHRQGRCGGFFDLTGRPPRRPAVPSFFVVDPFAHARRPTQHGQVNKLLQLLRRSRLEHTVQHLAHHHDRYYDGPGGVAAAQWLYKTFAKLAQKSPHAEVSVFRHPFAQPSVIARIRGKGDKAGEKVIVGAHLDSINWQFGSTPAEAQAPGADDDASGIAALLETFAALVQAPQPARTVELIAYAGEEMGLLGSQDIAASYADAQVPVLGVLQLDMTMFAGGQRAIHFVRDDTHPGLTRFVARLVETYLDVPAQSTSCGYACSDHASWHRHGFATVFPFEADFDTMNPSIHTGGDVFAAGLDADWGMQFAKLATAFAWEMAQL